MNLVNQKDSMNNFINSLTGRSIDARISVLEDKQKTINQIIYISNILGVTALVLEVVNYTRMGISGAAYLYFLFFSPFFLAFIFIKHLSLNGKALLIMLSSYLLASYVMYYEAFFGATLLIYLAMVVLSTFILGLRMGMIIFGLCSATIIVYGFLFVSKTIVVIPEILHSDENWSSWLVWLITFCFLVFTLSATVNRLYKKLQLSLSIAEKRSEEVIQSNKELSNIKANLEELVKQRTAEIHEKNQKLQASNEELKSLNLELERFNTLFVGREYRIKELRDKIKELEGKINREDTDIAESGI